MVYKIRVSEPVKIGEGMSAHTAYKLSVTLSERVADLEGLSFVTLRRFSDFVWLRAQFKEIYPFLIVPALPEKKQLGRFAGDFVEMRERALARWVVSVAAHPELSTSGESGGGEEWGRRRMRERERKHHLNDTH